MPFERGSVVDIETDSLLLRSGSAVKVKWPRNFLVPSLESIDVEKGLVDVKLYERNFNSESLPFREIATLASKMCSTLEQQMLSFLTLVMSLAKGESAKYYILVI